MESGYWREVLNFDAPVRHGMIDQADLGLFRTVDDPASALEILKTTLNIEPATATPAFAKSRVAQ